MKKTISRRNFVQSGALIAAALAAPGAVGSLAQQLQRAGKASPIQLGLASYTFRNFTRAQLIGFMKQINVTALNAKDVKDHLPSDPEDEAKALADYAAAGNQASCRRDDLLAKDDDADMRGKFEYCKRAGISVMVAGNPAPRRFRASKSSSSNTTYASPSTITDRKIRYGLRPWMS